MAGYRSIEVAVTNDTNADLTVEGVNHGGGSSWIQGETPTTGDAFPQYAAVLWGVSTNDTQGAAQGQVQLTGLGDNAVTIAIMNDASGRSVCTFVPNNVISGTPVQVQGREPNHSQFILQLNSSYASAASLLRGG